MRRTHILIIILAAIVLVLLLSPRRADSRPTQPDTEEQISTQTSTEANIFFCDNVTRAMPGFAIVLSESATVTPYGYGSSNQNAVNVVVRGADNSVWAATLRLRVGGYGNSAFDQWDMWPDGAVIWYWLGGQTKDPPLVYAGWIDGYTYTIIYARGLDGALYRKIDSWGLGMPLDWEYIGPIPIEDWPLSDRVVFAYGRIYQFDVEPLLPVIPRWRCTL